MYIKVYTKDENMTGGDVSTYTKLFPQGCP
jgi:hypothetical protein